MSFLFFSPIFLYCFFLFQTEGYNVVVRIPAGATNIDIRQVSYSGTPEDDNYLGMSSHFVQKDFTYIFKFG